ncbi:MAG: hypothetical protein ACAH59_07555 [Pseudobdellovibrionaceae bacterium]
MKFHAQGSAIFANLSEQAKRLYPNIQVITLNSKSGATGKEVVFVDENLEADQVIAEVINRNLHNLIQKNEGRFEETLLASGRLLENQKNYFQSDYCFFADHAETKVQIPFTGPPDKQVLKKLSLEFSRQVGNSSVVSAADAVIEELYMNAIIDAPREAKKKGIQSQGIECQLYLGKVKDWLQVSCTDPYGSLDIQQFLGRMSEVYTKGAGQAINLDDSGGAGLGCVILFEASACLILGVQPGVQTKVTCLIPLGISNRKRAEMKKSLHWFEL